MPIWYEAFYLDGCNKLATTQKGKRRSDSSCAFLWCFNDKNQYNIPSLIMFYQYEVNLSSEKRPTGT